MKTKLIYFAAAALLLTGCGGQGRQDDFQADEEIHVFSREEGSGTRGAFVELFGIEEETEDGVTVDNTTLEADITNNTAVMMTTVASDLYAIGYISLGSLNDTVKAVSIDGVYPSVDTVMNGSYAASRPFILAVTETLSPQAADFISFIQSAQGQDVILDAGYIPPTVNTAAPYTPGNVSGTVVVSGSSSVTPVMEKLAEAYQTEVVQVSVQVQQSDSTTGVNNTLGGICDIGMVSRSLKDSEIASGLSPIVIANDGITVIVNPKNTTDDLTSEQVKAIFTGVQLDWALS